jgi:DMSO/TMAO reductase YedYZ molybdopterin-dependent catalytic subunit
MEVEIPMRLSLHPFLPKGTGKPFEPKREVNMETRRAWIKRILFLVGGVLLSWTTSAGKGIAAAARVVLPKGTPRENLIDKNPADLDTSHLEVTPLEAFGTMGLTDHIVDIDAWRLEIDGLVDTPLRLRYEEILTLPFVEREVLLICPGFFANHGHWAGPSLAALLDRAGANPNAKRVHIRGPRGAYEKTGSYPIADVLSERVFLAHHVNGKPLPRKHGYPLRVVAEGYYGFDWIKYAARIQVE